MDHSRPGWKQTVQESGEESGISHLNGGDGEGEKQDHALKAQGPAPTEQKHS